MKKRISAFLLSLVLLFLFCGCSDKTTVSQLQTSLETVSEQESVLSEISSVFVSSEISEVSSSSAVQESSSKPAETSKAEEPKVTVVNHENLKAMWLSQFDLNKIYTDNGNQRDKVDFEQRILQVLSNVKENGFNTIFVQVRPYADSFYPSTLYPVSSYVSGDYGKNLSYDPFAIIVKKAHALGLSVHAWINPMRAMKETEIEKVPNIYLIKKWYNEKSEAVVLVNDRLYLNPAVAEVRKLIVDGVREIVRLYDVDGVHMDDYFYPTTEVSFDKETYESLKKENENLADFRRRAINTLVGEIYAAVKAKDNKLLFGISPAGNMETVFSQQYADIFTWCSQKGYIDYICPQVYFGLEHEFYPFDKVCEQWQSVITNEDVTLFIGMTLGKAKSKNDPYAGTGKDEWAKSTDILKRCLQKTESLTKCGGVSYFCYQYFYDPLTSAPDLSTKAERENFLPLLKEIKWK